MTTQPDAGTPATAPQSPAPAGATVDPAPGAPGPAVAVDAQGEHATEINKRAARRRAAADAKAYEQRRREETKDLRRAAKLRRRREKRDLRTRQRTQRLERKRISRLVNAARAQFGTAVCVLVYAAVAGVAAYNQAEAARKEFDWSHPLSYAGALFIEGLAVALAITGHHFALMRSWGMSFVAKSLSWAAAGFAAHINYTAHQDNRLEALALAGSSIAGIVLWELRSALRAKQLGTPRAPFGIGFVLRYPRLAWWMWSARLAMPHLSDLQVRRAAVLMLQASQRRKFHARLAAEARRALWKASASGDSGAVLARITEYAHHGLKAADLPALTAMPSPLQMGSRAAGDGLPTDGQGTGSGLPTDGQVPDGQRWAADGQAVGGRRPTDGQQPIGQGWPTDGQVVGSELPIGGQRPNGQRWAADRQPMGSRWAADGQAVGSGLPTDGQRPVRQAMGSDGQPMGSRRPTDGQRTYVQVSEWAADGPVCTGQALPTDGQASDGSRPTDGQVPDGQPMGRRRPIDGQVPNGQAMGSDGQAMGRVLPTDGQRPTRQAMGSRRPTGEQVPNRSLPTDGQAPDGQGRPTDGQQPTRKRPADGQPVGEGQFATRPGGHREWMARLGELAATFPRGQELPGRQAIKDRMKQNNSNRSWGNNATVHQARVDLTQWREAHAEDPQAPPGEDSLR